MPALFGFQAQQLLPPIPAFLNKQFIQGAIDVANMCGDPQSNWERIFGGPPKFDSYHNKNTNNIKYDDSEV